MKNKKNSFLIVVMACIFLSATYVPIYKTSGAHPGSTGAPGELSCAQNGCHNDGNVTVNPTGINSLIFSSIDSTYVPGQYYTITVKVQNTNISKFGFELVGLKDSDSLNVGQFTITDPNDPKRTQIISHFVGTNTRYSVTHTSEGTPSLSSGSTQWTFGWTAPLTDVGPITFYYATNCTNNNSSQTGDAIFLSSFKIKPKTILSIKENSNENNLKVFYNGDLKVISINYNLKLEKQVKILLIDESGREIMNLPETIRSQGNQKEKITLGNDFKPGVYFVNLVVDNVSTSKKIVIQ